MKKNEQQIRAAKILIAARFKCELIDDGISFIHKFKHADNCMVFYDRNLKTWRCNGPHRVGGEIKLYSICRHITIMSSALEAGFGLTV